MKATNRQNVKSAAADVATITAEIAEIDAIAATAAQRDGQLHAHGRLNSYQPRLAPPTTGREDLNSVHSPTLLHFKSGPRASAPPARWAGISFVR